MGIVPAFGSFARNNGRKAMRLQHALSIGDLERLAQKRLPRVLFECIGSGVEDEQGVIRNETAFHRHQLLARHLVDVSKRDQSTTIFGRTYASPFGISPMGDRKSTRLNSSHLGISYAVFCLKKK